MNLQDLNDLDLENIGSWPKLAKVIVIAILCLLILGGGYYYFIADAMTRLEGERQKETTLKSQFEIKAAMASNLVAYRQQLVELEEMLQAQLKQLPNKNEVAGLLDDISFIAADNGLKLKRINWEAEKQHEFSTELPMRIEVSGDYHQLGKFTADIAALPRIVILDSFKLTEQVDGEVAMAVLAKTFRYTPKQEAK